MESWNMVSGHFGQPRPQQPGPGLLVIHEWWGLDEQTCSIADRLAGAGYLSFAPDLYHGARASLGDTALASELLREHADGALATLERAFDGLLQHPECNGSIGAIGFCFGGRMALAIGLRRPVKAICTFYGGGMQVLFDQLDGLRSPVLGLYGDADTSIPSGTIEQFDRILDERGLEHEIVVYPRAGHAFFRDQDPASFRPEASADAWARTMSFLGRHLPRRASEHAD